MEAPEVEQWDFPAWLVGICKDSERFDEAQRILIEKYGFIKSPLEQEHSPEIGSLILPIPDIDLGEYFKQEKAKLFSGWGIGRTRFFNDDAEQRGGPSFEFKYFVDKCPWEYMKSNPMKGATIEVISILKPLKFIDIYRGMGISSPYK